MNSLDMFLRIAYIMAVKKLSWWVIILLIFSCSVAQAEGGKTSSSFQFGERRTSDIIAESVDYYSFYRSTSHIDFAGGPDLDYYLKYDFYKKDYDATNNYDNESDTACFGIDYLLKNTPGDKIKLDLDFLQRLRRYKNASSNEYDQTRIGAKLRRKRDEYSIGARLGLNYFNFTDADKDETEISGKLKAGRFFFDKKLKLKGFAGLTRTERESKKDKFWLAEGLTADLRIDKPLLKLLRAKIEYREANTKDADFEDRDDDYDFEHLRWYIRTKHELNKRLSTSFKYEDKSRDYADYNFDYDIYKVSNSTKYIFSDTKTRSLYSNLETFHKEEEFTDNDSKSRIRNGFKLKGTYNQKKNFKLQGEFGATKDEYGASVSSNKTTYSYKLGLEKKLGEDLSFKLGWKYKLRDQKYTADIEYTSYKAGVTYTW